jgi:hypothetical protein
MEELCRSARRPGVKDKRSRLRGDHTERVDCPEQRPPGKDGRQDRVRGLRVVRRERLTNAASLPAPAAWGLLRQEVNGTSLCQRGENGGTVNSYSP